MQEVLDRVADDILAGVHAIRERLDHADIGESIDDQAWEKVAFPVDEPVRARLRIQLFAKAEGQGDPLAEERRIDFFDAGGEEANGDERTRVEEPHAESPSAGVLNFHDISGSGGTRDGVDLVAEDPGMSGGDAVVFFPSENDPAVEMGGHHAQWYHIGQGIARTPRQGFSFGRGGFSVYFDSMPCSDAILSCVIFDVDGTLTRTNDLIFASFNHVAVRHLGRTFSPPEIIALFGPPEEGALLKVFGPEHLDTIMEELLEFYAANHAAMASLHCGMEDLLGLLRGEGVGLAVFTGKGRRTTAITLEALGVSRYFDFIVTGNDVVAHKPHPEGILRIIDHFGVSPRETLMIGDSLGDITASRAAGVRIASVLWDTYDSARVRAANPECYFETVEAMTSWIRRQFRDHEKNNRVASA